MVRHSFGGYKIKHHNPAPPPYHVHIYNDRGFVGRFNIEAQVMMETGLPVTGKLKKALIDAGYYIEKKG